MIYVVSECALLENSSCLACVHTDVHLPTRGMYGVKSSVT